MPHWVTNLARVLLSRLKYNFIITPGKCCNVRLVLPDIVDHFGQLPDIETDNKTTNKKRDRENTKNTKTQTQKYTDKTALFRRQQQKNRCVELRFQ